MCCLRLIRQIRGRAFLRQWLTKATAAASWGACMGADKGRKQHQRPAAPGTSLAWEPRFSPRTCASLPQRRRSPGPHRRPSAAFLKGGSAALPKKMLRSRAARHVRYLQPCTPGSPRSEYPAAQVGHADTEGNPPLFSS